MITKILGTLILMLSLLSASEFLYIKSLMQKYDNTIKELSLCKDTIVDMNKQVHIERETVRNEIEIIKVQRTIDKATREEVENENEEFILASKREPTREKDRINDINDAFNRQYGSSGWMLSED